MVLTKQACRHGLVWVLSLAMLQAQQQTPLPAGIPGPAAPAGATQAPAMPGLDAADTEKLRLTYVLGPNDQVSIRVPEATELDGRTFRVDAEGSLVLPVVGTMKAAGLTVQQFESALTTELARFYRNPHPVVGLVQLRSDFVFFTGPFRNAGMVQLPPGRKLTEMLITGAGGLAQNASKRLRLTRRTQVGPIPLSKAIVDRERGESWVEISINEQMQTVAPEEDIVLLPNDVIRAGSEELIYLSGALAKPGPYTLGDRGSISVLQMLSMCGGLASNASARKAKIMRPVLDTARRADIPVDLQAIMEGRTTDFQLLPNDILFVPTNQSAGRIFSRYGAIIVTSVITSLIFALIR
jgi:polysaccharide export outer membrane protein